MIIPCILFSISEKAGFGRVGILSSKRLIVSLSLQTVHVPWYNTLKEAVTVILQPTAHAPSLVYSNFIDSHIYWVIAYKVSLNNSP